MKGEGSRHACGRGLTGARPARRSADAGPAVRLRERGDAGPKRKAIENEANGDSNDSAPEQRKTAKPLFVL